MSSLAHDHAVSSIVDVTPAAITELLQLRSEEPDGPALGLRLSIISDPGKDFRYDLSFDTVAEAAPTDELRTYQLPDDAEQTITVIIPADDVHALQGATLDRTERQGLVIRNPNKPRPPAVEGLTADDELSGRIEQVINDEVNPALAMHGGYVTYVGHDGAGTVFLTMGGGCHGCSMSMMTMLEGVQTMLIEQIPSIERVRDLTDHTTGDNPYYR